MHEKQKLKLAVKKFSRHMMDKLFEKFNEGKRGWDNPNCFDGIEMLLDSCWKQQKEEGGQETDIANLAMFLYFLNNNELESSVELSDAVLRNMTPLEILHYIESGTSDATVELRDNVLFQHLFEKLVKKLDVSR